MLSAKEKDRAYNILSEYQGRNYYILTLRRNVYILKQVSLNDFEAEYIIKNYDKETVQVNKVVKISDWYSKTIRENKKLDFSPEKIKIISLIGETDKIFHCLVQYKQSIPAEFMFIPKQAILNDFLSEEYKDLKLDFVNFSFLILLFVVALPPHPHFFCCHRRSPPTARSKKATFWL